MEISTSSDHFSANDHFWCVLGKSWEQIFVYFDLFWLQSRSFFECFWAKFGQFRIHPNWPKMYRPNNLLRLLAHKFLGKIGQIHLLSPSNGTQWWKGMPMRKRRTGPRPRPRLIPPPPLPLGHNVCFCSRKSLNGQNWPKTLRGRGSDFWRKKVIFWIFIYFFIWHFAF